MRRHGEYPFCTTRPFQAGTRLPENSGVIAHDRSHRPHPDPPDLWQNVRLRVRKAPDYQFVEGTARFSVSLQSWEHFATRCGLTNRRRAYGPLAWEMVPKEIAAWWSAERAGPTRGVTVIDRHYRKTGMAVGEVAIHSADWFSLAYGQEWPLLEREGRLADNGMEQAVSVEKLTR